MKKREWKKNMKKEKYLYKIGYYTHEESYYYELYYQKKFSKGGLEKRNNKCNKSHL